MSQDAFTDLIISSMRWSFSRLDAYNQCPYGWKLTYIDQEECEGNCFSEFGTAVHKTLERLEKGEIDVLNVVDAYTEEFDNTVEHSFPSESMRDDYFEKGLNFFSSLTDEFDNIKILGVEEKISFEIAGKPFVGFIDLRYQDKDGNMVLLDWKSSGMKLKKDGKPTKAYADKMKHYEYQIYLYSIPFIEKGIKIDKLRWNFCKEGITYEIPWTEEGYKEAVEWAEDTLSRIETETEFETKPEYFFCNWICDQRKNCAYGYHEDEDEDEEDDF